MHSPWFFDRLGIASTTDAKQIKRAYALALKAIDQQTEREAFETLRTAYEQALAWSKAPKAAAGLPQDGASLVFHTTEPGPSADHGGGLPRPADHADQVRADDEDGHEVAHDVVHELADEVAHDVVHEVAQNAPLSTIRLWVARLMHPEGAPLGPLLDAALADPSLWHLDAREQLEMMLIDALYRAPLAQSELFELAAAGFDWSAQRALPRLHHPRGEWVSRVIDQALLWEALAPRAKTALAAALKAASATDQPSDRQAYMHHAALADLGRDFLAWSALFLPRDRFDVWQRVHEGLPAGRARRLAVEQGVVRLGAWCCRVFVAILRFVRDRLLDTRSSRLAFGVLAFAIAYGMLTDGFKPKPPTEADRVSAQLMLIAYANARRMEPLDARAPGLETPVSLARWPGNVDRLSCSFTHGRLHKREEHVFNDPAFIASLSTHAMLCNAHDRWPQLSDPIVSCLQREFRAADNEDRPQSNAHCAAALAEK